jgi:choline dehydrogenase-like flavoprotein
MFIDAEQLQESDLIQADVAIIGAGPAGIVSALELAKAGYSVALIESGHLKFSEAAQTLGDASHFDPQFHAPMSDCNRRQLGGTSVIWGGRCVPFDPVDFDPRSHIAHSDWPVTYDELTPYFSQACEYFVCGDSKFSIDDYPEITQKSIVPGLPDADVLTSTLERWSLPTNFGKEYAQALKQSNQIKVFYNLTCTQVQTNEAGTHATGLQTQTLGGKAILVETQYYILAGGALNTTRLLLASDQRHPGGIGNHSGLLGRFYMGHLSGDIAIAKFTTPPQQTIFSFDRDQDNIYLRRRLSFSREFQHEKQLSNTVAWLGTPQFDDPAHKSAVLSFAYLALSNPLVGKYLAAKAIRQSAAGDDTKAFFSHAKNIVQDLGTILTFVPNFGYKRYIARRKIPALFIYSGSNEYNLHYHAEQIPNYDSIVSLAEERDQLGMRKLNIDLRYTQQDIDSVVRSHQYWDEHLRQHNCGYLKYLTDDPEASVWQQASDGFHQNGTTRMSDHPENGVVSSNCNVHGIDNLFVASSSNFVTSSQANSTFMIVVFALRLTSYIKSQKS